MRLSEKEQRLIEAYRLGLSADEFTAGATEITAEAMIAVSKGQKYNRNDLTFPDYIPNGLPDLMSKMLEPFARIHSGAGLEQERDVISYASLFLMWVRMGMPESKYREVITPFLDKFYKNLKEKDANADRRASSKCA